MGGGSNTDIEIVEKYLHSPDILARLNEEAGVFDHYTSHEWDIISRLPADATREEFLEYYQDMIDVIAIPETGIVTIRVSEMTWAKTSQNEK